MAVVCPSPPFCGSFSSPVPDQWSIFVFALAFCDLLYFLQTNRTERGARCNQAIMIVTDGSPDTYEEIFEKYNSPQRRVRQWCSWIYRERANKFDCETSKVDQRFRREALTTILTLALMFLFHDVEVLTDLLSWRPGFFGGNSDRCLRCNGRPSTYLSAMCGNDDIEWSALFLCCCPSVIYAVFLCDDFTTIYCSL